MLFTSLDFFLFLLVTLLAFAVTSASNRFAVVLVASWIFYGYAHPQNLVYLGAITLVVWACGRSIEASGDHVRRRRRWLVAGLVAVLGSLTALKFYDFLAGEIERLASAVFARDETLTLPRLGLTAPAGYSFYAFAAASYLIDTYTRRVATMPGAGRLAAYIAWFPKILAGPIERAPSFLPQLAAGLRADPDDIVLGFQLIAWGLVKKVVIADNLAPVVDHAFNIAAFASPIELLVSVYFFAFQIYCDFSGYTDIAIGVSLLFGVKLMENFRRPYFSVSTAEFWGERWHISLGRWFRDYLYIPLGGSRVGAARLYLNVMFVFLVSGIWHAGLGYGVGWTFLVWGALNGAYQCAGVATRPIWRRAGDAVPRIAASSVWRVLRVLFTFHLIAITWIFFRAKSIPDALLILRKIGAQALEIPSLLTRYPFTTDQYIGFGLIVFLLVIELVDERRSLFQRLARAPVALRWGAGYAAVLALLVLGRWQTREFIYMQF